MQRQSPEPPDPLDWRDPPRFRDRLLRAVGAPVIVGVVLFTGGVATAVVLGLVQSQEYGSETSPVEGSAAATSAPQSPAEVAMSDRVGGVDRADGGTGGNGAGAAPGVTAGRVRVHVVGKVKSPGVVELLADARVEDAIEAAGGATDRRALASVNLARQVRDGEQIVVARMADPQPSGAEANANAPGAPATISLNTADAQALESLPSVGPALAQRIIEWRQSQGEFSRVEQLLDVPGIGPKTLAGFRDRVSV